MNAHLLENELDPNPFTQFGRWFEEAKQHQPLLPEAMTVATCADGVVSARVCLLKEFGEHGFVFFTNYHSHKAEQIHENPRVALCFYWAVLERQVRVDGVAVKVTEEESDEYWATRPRGSQIGAWTSSQSAVISCGRGDLEQRFHEIDTTYRDLPIPRPPHWGGYRVIPVELEFWQGRADRLHDRMRYRLREPKDWIIERLAP